jgi:hypothetical protein
MGNITVAVSDDTYRQARIRAAKNDTSVSAVVPDLLLCSGGRRNVSTLPPTPPRALTAKLKTSIAFGAAIL